MKVLLPVLLSVCACLLLSLSCGQRVSGQHLSKDGDGDGMPLAADSMAVRSIIKGSLEANDGNDDHEGGFVTTKDPKRMKAAKSGEEAELDLKSYLKAKEEALLRMRQQEQQEQQERHADDAADMATTNTAATSGNGVRKSESASRFMIALFDDDFNCTLCEPGSYANQNCSSDCPQVPGECPMGNCTLCDPGSYQPDPGAATPCILCPEGSAAHRHGAINCTGCTPGTYAGSQGLPDCLPCNPGYHCSENNCTTCARCDSGFSSNPGAANCTPCDPGSYNSGGTMIICALCIPGYYAEEYNSTGCSPCDKGSYAKEHGSKECTLCSPGSYQNFPASSSCISCTKGFYLAATGATSNLCKLCPPQHYCPFDQTGDPIPCPDDAYCPAGSADPDYCPPLFEATVNGCTARSDIIAVVSCLSVVCLLVLAFIGYRRYRKYQLNAEERAELLAKRSTGEPVYQGY